MTDKINELKSIHGAAKKANTKLGNSPEGIDLLNNQTLGSIVLDEYVENYENSTENLRLEEENTRDHLTGAFNRPYLEREVNKLLSERKPFAFFLCDLDGLKGLNDTYGHAVGDLAIKHFVNVSNRVIKAERVAGQEDVLARLGGDEFAFILRGVTNLGTAREIGERIVTELKNTKFSSIDGDLLNFSASGGITIVRANDSFETLTRRTDMALYEAKKAGKDRIVEKY